MAGEKDDAPPPDSNGSQLDRRMRPPSVITYLVGKGPKGLRQAGGETRTPARLLKSCLVAAASEV